MKFYLVTRSRTVADLRSELLSSGRTGFCFGAAPFGYGFAVIVYQS